MPGALDELKERVERIQHELEETIAERREALNFTIRNRRAVFEREVLDRHRKARMTIMRYIAGARPAVILTAPVIYSLIVPFVILDLAVTAYQAICFPAYGLQKVRRADFIIFDRHRLAYLNGIEKLNCLYCSYVNGLIAYVREIAARTESRWCPIKHARTAPGTHPVHGGFADYGDDLAYRDITEDRRRKTGR